jgi:hypothetical protein
MPPATPIFLGFENGEVVSFQPGTGEVHLLTRETGPILSLVVDPSRTYLLILSEMGPDKVCLRVISRQVGYRMIDYYWLTVAAPTRLALPALNSKSDRAMLCHGNEYRLFTLPNLIADSSNLFSEDDEVPESVLYGMLDGRPTTLWMLALYDHHAELSTGLPPHRKTHKVSLSWTPAVGTGSTLLQAPLRGVMVQAGVLEIAGLDARGSLQRTTLHFKGVNSSTTTFHPVGGDRYRAFACVRTDVMAGVHAQGIDWWTPTRVRPAQTRLALGNPVAAFPLPDTLELLIVSADGLLTRVPITE